MNNNFVSAKAGTQYVLLCTGTFLCFLTTSTLTLLSVIFKSQEYSSQQIGLVLSSPIVPVLAALLISGSLSRKYGASKIMIISQLISIAAFIALEYGSSSFVSAFMLRAAIGFGFGLYFTASMIYARAILTGTNLLYYFGIFASMIPLPNAIGPYIAEIYIGTQGVVGFFVLMSVPAVLGFLVLFLLHLREDIKEKCNTPDLAPISYKYVLLRKEFMAPSLGIFFVGLVWGFAVAYMALYLHPLNISVGLFFAPLTVILFLSRFGLVRYLQSLGNSSLSFLSLLLIGVSYSLLAFFPSSVTVVICGLLFGLGYSLAFPVFNVWSTGALDVAARPTAIALFNAFFHGGMFFIPLFVGAMPSIDLQTHIILLAVAACLCSVVFYSLGRTSK